MEIEYFRHLVLASQSPRRHQLLKEAKISFTPCSAETPEVLDLSLGLDAAILEIAKAKALAAAPQILKMHAANSVAPLVLSSDTLVVLRDQILGKPKTISEALSFLNLLSDRTHQVKTAVHFWDVSTDSYFGEVETSNVTFRKLTANEMKCYVESGEPMDKAGAYGIQGVGRNFISNLDGNLDNVMGLSITLVHKLIKENGWILK